MGISCPLKLVGPRVTGSHEEGHPIPIVVHCQDEATFSSSTPHVQLVLNIVALAHRDGVGGQFLVLSGTRTERETPRAAVRVVSSLGVECVWEVRAYIWEIDYSRKGISI